MAPECRAPPAEPVPLSSPSPKDGPPTPPARLPGKPIPGLEGPPATSPTPTPIPSGCASGRNCGEPIPCRRAPATRSGSVLTGPADGCSASRARVSRGGGSGGSSAFGAGVASLWREARERGATRSGRVIGVIEERISRGGTSSSRASSSGAGGGASWTRIGFGAGAWARPRSGTVHTSAAWRSADAASQQLMRVVASALMASRVLSASWRSSAGERPRAAPRPSPLRRGRDPIVGRR